MDQFAADPEQQYRCRTCGALISTPSSVTSLPRGEDGVRIGECYRCGAPQIHDQLEELFDTVWKAEANWCFDDGLEIQE